MKHRLYPISLLALACGLLCCSPQAVPSNTEASSPQNQVFSSKKPRQPYQAPAAGCWPQRYLQHLLVGSKKSHHFAMERLLDLGASAAAPIAEEIRVNKSNPAALGYLVNLCSALAGSHVSAEGEVLFELLGQKQPPVVRSAAYEALAELLPPDPNQRTLELVRLEQESAPRIAGFRALAKYGNHDGMQFLFQLVKGWLESADASLANQVPGQDAWNALLLVENPEVAFFLQRLESLLPPYLSLEAYGVRIDLGETDLAEAIRPFMNAEQYPSPGTRSLALELLAELGDWDSVLAARLDGANKVQMTLVGVLRRPDAVEAKIGQDLLEEWATNAPDPELKYQALRGLLERGYSNRLDPYLRLAREFPLAKGSMEALQVLGKEGIADARTASILIPRWPYCEGNQRIDLLRALTRTGSMEAANFLLTLALDQEKDPEIGHLAATILANFGEQVVPLFVRLWRERPTLNTALSVVPGLGRYPQVPAARDLLRELAASSVVDDRIRRATLEKFPLIFKQQGFDLLMDLLQHEERAEIKVFIESILNEYY